MAMHLVKAESLIRDLWYQIFRSEEGGIPASQRQNLQYKRPGLALLAAGRHTWDDYQDKLTGVKRVSFNIAFGD